MFKELKNKDIGLSNTESFGKKVKPEFFDKMPFDTKDNLDLKDGSNGKYNDFNEKHDFCRNDNISKEIVNNEDMDQGEISDCNECQVKNGGSYRDVKKTSDGETHEVHHMPADSASNLERDDGPAIKMEKEDHRQTSSCGSSKEAREYREQQKELIEQKKFREALQLDIDDIHEKFGDKYDDAIAEMIEYVNQLEQEGRI